MDDFRPLQLKHYLVFLVADQKFAIDICDIESIQASNRKDALDDMEDLKAAVRLLKKVVPIINLRNKLKLRGTERLVQPSLVFVKRVINKTVSLVGVQVDQILEIVETLVPKKTNGKSNRLIKVMVGLKTEVITVLRFSDIVEEGELSPIESEVLN
jgi:chemotaxis signal transduction protein